MAIADLRIKRRDVSNTDDNAPSSLLQGELAFNEYQQVLHYGLGSSPAVTAIGGPGINARYPTTTGFIVQNALRSGATPPTTESRSIAGTANEIGVTNGDGVSGNPTLGIVDNAVMPGVEGIILPSGTTAQRVATEGYIRYNTDDNIIEWRDNDSWEQPDIGGGEANVDCFGIVTGDTGTATADLAQDTLDIAGGEGIVTIAATTPDSLTIDMDIPNATSLGAAPATGDQFILYDITGTEHKEVTFAEMMTSPALTGTPTAPTAAKATDTTQIATTAHVKSLDVNDLTAPTGDFDMNSNKITSLATPTADDDAATKAYADSIAGGFDYKESVQLAETSGNLDLTGEETIDGTLTSTSRVLVTQQTATEDNGIYDTGAGAWTRATDADTSAEVTAGMSVFVSEGTSNADSVWTLTTNDTIVLDTTGLTFTQTSGLGQILAGNGLTKSANTINAVGTASRISVAADSIDIDSSYVGQATITTLGTVSTGTWEGTTVDELQGGTGFSTYAQGDIMYASATNVLSKLAKGASGSVLAMNSGATIPEWATVIDGGTF